MRRVPRHRITDGLDQIIALAVDLDASTLVIDVEPLLAEWDSPPEVFLAAVRRLHAAVVERAPSVTDLVFASNAGWPPQPPPEPAGPRMAVVSPARKPWRTRYLDGLPAPIVFAGDQVLTDGLLAWRLRGDFLHCANAGEPPLLARVQSVAGRCIAPLVFVAASRIGMR
ncbi:hypothetical protein ABZ806_12925 [Spirillospora sp. NPDC047418]